MKKNLIIIMLALLFFPLLTDICICGDSSTIMISCTIPAIPGVNAPLIEKETTINLAIQERLDFKKEELKQLNPAMIQQDIQKKETSGSTEKQAILVKTIYSR